MSDSGIGLIRSVERRLDDEAATRLPGFLAGFLQDELGQKTAARLVGLGDSRQIGRYRRGDGPSPRPGVEMRLREAYKLVGMISSAFDSTVARSWLLGTNSELNDQAPIDVFSSIRDPSGFAAVRSAARRFVISSSMVRDPMLDLDAVHAARERPMSERLERALSWNLLVSELRSGLKEVKDQ